MKESAKNFRASFYIYCPCDFFYIPFHSAYSLVIAGPIVKPHA